MTSAATPLDSDWLRSNPLPVVAQGADKNSRGRVLAIGGCRIVPGGIMLTAEAALRAGAGKIQIATIQSAALAVGVAMPEAAVFGLPENDDGELYPAGGQISELMGRCDAVIAGPGSRDGEAAAKIVAQLLAADPDCESLMVLDAAALMALRGHAADVKRRSRPAVLTPHTGEMAALLGCEAGTIDRDRAAAVRRTAEAYGAICVLKGPTSLIAHPDGRLFGYAGGGAGLATGGSGDVMAGIAAGLAARGADPLVAALWAVWLHGEAGRRCAEQLGPIGFLARELLIHVPALMRAL